MAVPMTADQANAIYDLLVLHADASDEGRDDFVCYQVDVQTTEYRFQGSLGFGGKFWNCNGRWYVTAYPEDIKRQPEMQAKIDACNQALAALKQKVPT